MLNVQTHACHSLGCATETWGVANQSFGPQYAATGAVTFVRSYWGGSGTPYFAMFLSSESKSNIWNFFELIPWAYWAMVGTDDPAGVWCPSKSMSELLSWGRSKPIAKNKKSSQISTVGSLLHTRSIMLLTNGLLRTNSPTLNVKNNS